jgi:transposase
MNSLTFTQKEIQKLHNQRFNHPDPKIQKRLEALYLKSKGMTHEQICSLIQVSSSTLTRWVGIYRAGGYNALIHTEYGNRKSQLEPHRELLKAHFEKEPPSSVAEATAAIEKMTSITLGYTQVRMFLKSMGFKFRKTGGVPRKADPEKQEQFKKKAWSLD